MLKVIFVFLISATNAFAYINYKSQNGAELTSIFEGPASVALGGTGLAAKSPNESGHMNPATLPMLDGSHFGFIYGAESLGARTGSNKYHIVVSEASDEVAFPGSLTYSKVGIFKDGKDVTIQQLTGAAGVEVSEFVSIGVGIKYMILEAVNQPQLSAYNGQLGLLVSPHPSFGIAFVYDDFLDTKDIPTNSTVGLGGQYVFEKIMRLRLDFVQPQEENPNKRVITKAGLESLFLNKDVSVRVGYRWDDVRDQRYFTTGIGWQGPRLGLNYAYEKNALSEDYRHLIDMLLQF